MAKPSMTIQLKKGAGAATFEVVSDGKALLTVSMPGVSSATAREAEAMDSVTVSAGDDARVIAHVQSDESLYLSVIRNTTAPETFTFLFGGDVTIVGTSEITVQSPAARWTGFSSNMSFSPAKHGTLVHCTSAAAYVQFKLAGAGGIEALSVGQVTAMSGNPGELIVPAGAPLPQFSIGVFDDPGRTRPRPVRLGVPVISTVPTYGSSLTASEKQLLDLGAPADRRKMYFRILASQPIPTNVTPVLRINLPAGLDTVGAPVDVVMSRANSENTLFHASYEFRREDTITWVDGFCYFSVFVPMVVNTDLSVGFDISSDGESLVYRTEDSPLDG